MKLALLCLATLVLLCVSAQAVPLPPPSLRASSLRLSKRLPDETRAALESAEKVLTAVRESGRTEQAIEKKDWKRPVILSIGAAGLIQTVGWNYIAAKSFSDNRNKYLDAKRKAAELKATPLPKVGDTLCTFETYRTQDEVASRKPSQVQAPCFQLGSDGAAKSASPNVATPTTDAGKQAAASLAGQTFADGRQGAASGKNGWTRRGLSSNTLTLGEMVKDTSTTFEHAPLFRSHGSTSSSLADLMRLNRQPNLDTLEERTHLLPSRHGSPSNSLVRQRLATLPGFPVLTPVDSPKASTLMRDFPPHTSAGSNSIDEASPRASPRRWAWIKKARSASTDDLVFALTVLNSISSIPSLTLTLINAYYYRGNPKVD